MSLTVSVRPERGMEAVPHLCLEDDGYYWFLHPWLESLREQTGKYLDLYGDVVFTRDDFPRLRRLLDEAQAFALARTAKWDVCVGMQLNPTKGPIHRPVQRDRVLAMIEAFRTLVAAAERSGRQLECLGD